LQKGHFSHATALPLILETAYLNKAVTKFSTKSCSV
jgi:hypothetical protein